MKKAYVLVLFVALTLISAISVGAIATSPNLPLEEEPVRGVMVEQLSNGSYMRTLSGESLDEVMPDYGITDEQTLINRQQKLVEALKALGYYGLELEALEEKRMIEHLENAQSITTVCTYYRYLEGDGIINVISEDDFYQGVADYTQKMAQNTLARNGGSNTEYSDDTLFKITTTAIYHPDYLRDDEGYPEDGWYTFIGDFTFVGELPDYRLIDAASIYVDLAHVAWGDYDSDYMSTMVTEYVHLNKIITENKFVVDRSIEPGGVYYTWDLPGFSYYYGEPVGISISVQGNARVSDYTNPRAFNLFTRYEHFENYWHLTPSFTWDLSTGAFGVSVTPEWRTDTTTYSSFCYVSYVP